MRRKLYLSHPGISVIKVELDASLDGSPFQDLLEPILDWAFAQENRAHLPILLLDDLHRVCAEAWFPRLASFLQTAVNAQRLSLILAGQQVLIEELRQDTSPLRLLIAGQFVLERLTLLETREFDHHPASEWRAQT